VVLDWKLELGCGLCKAEEEIPVVVSTTALNRGKVPVAGLSLPSGTPERPKLFTVNEEVSGLEESVRVRVGNQSIGASSQASGARRQALENKGESSVHS